jgi:asparagine synthase (glutamine-hydrolysing)
MKGTGTPFYQQLVRRNRNFLRDRLLDSRLVREGYLDRNKLIDYFAAEEPFMMCGASQIMAYLSAEIWLQQWADADANAIARRFDSCAADRLLGAPSALAS